MIDLGEAVEETRLAFSALLGAWQSLPDDPEEVAAIFENSKSLISVTGVAEKLRSANRSARLVTEIITEAL